MLKSHMRGGVRVLTSAQGSDYASILGCDKDSLPRFGMLGMSTTLIANRVSYFFDLKGPSLSIDTACSSSMNALHLACQSIRTGESRAALVGGTNILVDPQYMVMLSRIGYKSFIIVAHDQVPRTHNSSDSLHPKDAVCRSITAPMDTAEEKASHACTSNDLMML